MIRKYALAVAAVSAILSATSAFAADHAIEIKGMKFSVPSISVAVGDTVTFTNVDGAPHTATAKDGSFDTGRLSKGESAVVMITAAGEFSYFCAVHPSMKGKIVAQ